MSLARSLLLSASRNRWLAERFMRRTFARRAVKRFMPGEELSDALDAARELAKQKIGTTITRLGESLTGESQADAVRDHDLSTFDLIKREGLPVVISVKPTQLGLDLSFDRCLAHMEALAARAAETGSQLCIDMEGSGYVDRTLDLYRRVKKKYDPVAVCVQSYLRRTAQDVESLMEVKPIIRVVKGAYAEPPDIAFQSKKEVDLSFIAISERLLEAATRGGATLVLGTHDLTIVQHLLARASQLGLPRSACEVHMLYGIRMAEQRRLAAEGYSVRCLVSYGEKWFPWYMRRLAERPANVVFMVRSVFTR
jgi:proline dehydrogenase